MYKGNLNYQRKNFSQLFKVYRLQYGFRLKISSPGEHLQLFLSSHGGR